MAVHLQNLPMINWLDFLFYVGIYFLQLLPILTLHRCKPKAKSRQRETTFSSHLCDTLQTKQLFFVLCFVINKAISLFSPPECWTVNILIINSYTFNRYFLPVRTFTLLTIPLHFATSVDFYGEIIFKTKCILKNSIRTFIVTDHPCLSPLFEITKYFSFSSRQQQV